jgi:hypothetical protein
MKTRLWIIGFLVCAVAALLPVRAAADGGVSPWIFALTQHDQTVSVQIGIAETGVGWDSCVVAGAPCVLSRKGPSGAHVVFDDHLFSFEDAESANGHCYSPENVAYCETAPEGECEDCDGDSVKECVVTDGGCFTWFLFTFEDTCVSPGLTTYTLHSAWDAQDEFGNDDTDSIDVTDSADAGDACVEADAGTDAAVDTGDTDTEGPDSDSGADSGGSCECSLIGIGAGAGEGALAFLMLLVGAIALAVARRRA